PSPLDREIARQLKVGGFRDVVSAKDLRALEPADRRDDDDGAVLAFDHALRDEMTTLAPCSASRSAMARPMPREEPVTIATRPVKSKRLVKVSSLQAI